MVKDIKTTKAGLRIMTNSNHIAHAEGIFKELEWPEFKDISYTMHDSLLWFSENIATIFHIICICIHSWLMHGEARSLD